MFTGPGQKSSAANTWRHALYGLAAQSMHHAHSACSYSANHGRCIYVMSIDSELSSLRQTPDSSRHDLSTRHAPSCTLPRFTRFCLRESILSHALPHVSLLSRLPTVPRRPVAAPRMPNTLSCCNHNAENLTAAPSPPPANPAQTADSESELYICCYYSVLQYRSNKPDGNTASMTRSPVLSRTDLRYRAFGSQLAASVNFRELVYSWVSCYPVVIAACSTNLYASKQGQSPMPTCLHEPSSAGVLSCRRDLWTKLTTTP
jgi:hypothetical protein